MELAILENIPFTPEPERLIERLGLGSMEEMAGELAALIDQAERLARPRGCYALFPVEKTGDRTVAIGGREFDSRILRVNLDQAGRAALFIATCGVELERWAETYEDLLLRWVAEAVCEEALRAGRQAVEQALEPLLGGKHQVSMNPGSLEDWPLTQQAPLFEALGNASGLIGVELTESYLMRPRKSLSGISYGSAAAFENCLLCPREDCRGRRMKFDAGLFEELYQGAKHGGLYAESCSCGHDSRR